VEDSQEWVPASVQVPARRLSDFYRWYGDWLGRPSSPTATYDDHQTQADRKTWSQEEDSAIATVLYEMVSTKARAILDFWMDYEAGAWVSGEETARATGLNGPYGVAGSLSSIGKAASKLSIELPFEYAPGETGASGRYRMSEYVARLFRAPRDQSQNA
jgi:hypothetical protein